MPVYIAAALQALIYLWAVPIHLAFRVDGANGLRFGVGLAAFDRSLAARRSKVQTAARSKSEAGGRDKRLALKALMNMKLSSASLTGRLGLGDAALTALGCGTLTILARILAARAERSRVELRPDFASAELRISLQGMLCARAGQIMLALLRAKSEHSKGSVRAWKDIPSKIS